MSIGNASTRKISEATGRTVVYGGRDLEANGSGAAY